MTSLIKDLDDSSLRYLEIRIQYLKLKLEGGDLREIEEKRTIAHDALIANFNAVLRNLSDKPKEMVAAAQAGRVAIGDWGLERALKLVRGFKEWGKL